MCCIGLESLDNANNVIASVWDFASVCTLSSHSSKGGWSRIPYPRIVGSSLYRRPLMWLRLSTTARTCARYIRRLSLSSKKSGVALARPDHCTYSLTPPENFQYVVNTRMTFISSFATASEHACRRPDPQYSVQV